MLKQQPIRHRDLQITAGWSALTEVANACMETLLRPDGMPLGLQPAPTGSPAAHRTGRPYASSNRARA